MLGVCITFWMGGKSVSLVCVPVSLIDHSASVGEGLLRDPNLILVTSARLHLDRTNDERTTGHSCQYEFMFALD